MATYYSKAHRLSETIRTDIESGVFALFSRLPGEQRLAGMYNAARCTIRKALARLIDEGLLVRQGTRLVVNPEASNKGASLLLRKSTRRIAVVIPNDDQLTSGFTSGIFELAANDETACFLFILGSRIPAELRRPESFDGMILMPEERPPFHELYEIWKNSGRCVVFLDRKLGNVEAPLVETDNSGAAYRAVTRLLSLYRRPVFFFSHPLDESTSTRERYNGYCNAMHDAGYGDSIEEHTVFFVFINLRERPDLLPMSGAMRKLRTLTPPLSIFAVNDLAAYAVYASCSRLGLKIGDNVKIIGFDDTQWAYCARPRLSSVRQPPYEVGQVAYRLLMRLFENPEPAPPCIRLPARLIEKESS